MLIPSYDEVYQSLLPFASAERVEIGRVYFGIVPGGYGEGDILLGVPTPILRQQSRRLARVGEEILSSELLEQLLVSPIHDCRFLALAILVERIKRSKYRQEHDAIRAFYLTHLDYVNNWDLVDISAPWIVGETLCPQSPELLYTLYQTEQLWRQRVAIVATLRWPKRGVYDPSLTLARMALSHEHHLIHKAAGWILREVGKASEAVLTDFLESYARAMPRTMLSYATERLEKEVRDHFRKCR